MTLKQLSALLLTITPNVYHNEAFQEDGSYIVWAEDGQAASLYANDSMQIQVIEGTIDLFTKIEFDPMFNTIQTTLDGADLTWELNSTQHEEKIGYTHHEWLWRIENGTDDY